MQWRHLLLGLAMATPSVWAGDALTHAIQKAYAPYRQALFATNAGSVDGATKALDTAQAQWAHVVVEYGDRAPAPYDNDKQLTTTFKQVSEVYAKAQEEVRAGKLPAAHDTLEAIRDLLSDLRVRNDVIVFSDRMNAYHAEMERMLIEGPAWLKADDGVARAQSQAGVLAYLAGQLEIHATASLQSDADFKTGLAALKTSVANLQKATVSRNKDAIAKAMAGLKKPYSQLFLMFG